jgi:GAF domain
MTDPKPAPEIAAAVARHGRDLKRANDKLRDLIGTLRASRDRLAESHSTSQVAGAPDPKRSPDRLRPAGSVQAPTPVSERQWLEIELAEAREQLTRAAAERDDLRKQLAGLTAEHRRLCDEFAQVAEQASELTQVHAALLQINGAAGREELLQALQDVVVSMVGSEELAIFDLRDGALHLARAFGVEAAPLRQIALGEGVIGRTAQSGRLYVAGREGPAEDPFLTACVPLKVAGEVVGAIAIYRLLGHKAGLGPSDQALFDLLIQHGGQALINRQQGGQPW